MIDLDHQLASIVNEHACVIELFVDRVVLSEDFCMDMNSTSKSHREVYPL